MRFSMSLCLKGSSYIWTWWSKNAKKKKRKRKKEHTFSGAISLWPLTNLKCDSEPVQIQKRSLKFKTQTLNMSPRSSSIYSPVLPTRSDLYIYNIKNWFSLQQTAEHLCTLTWPKVHSRIEALYRATLEKADWSAVCGEQHHLLTQVRPEQLGQVTHVVVVAGEITSILILHLSTNNILYITSDTLPASSD